MNKYIILLICILADFTLVAQYKYIEVNTLNTSLVLCVNQQHNLYLLHYGSKIKNPEQLLVEKPQLYEAYPAFGFYTEFHQPFSMTQSDGNMSARWQYVSHEQQKLNKDITHTIVKMKDEHYPVRLEINYLSYLNEDIVEQWVAVYNDGKQAVKIHEYASSYLHFKRDKYFLTHFYGSWGNEMNMKEEELSYGMKIVDTKLGVEAGDMHTAAYILSFDKPATEDDAEVIMGALSWSGNYRFTFDVDVDKHLHINSGINPYLSTYTLEPKQELTTPKMIQTYTKQGKGQASRNFHRWARNYIIPISTNVRKTVINSWEAVYFMPDANNVKKIIDGASALGIEMFVLDDGWFGNNYPRNNSKAGLGDWQVNKKKFPKGLEELIEYAAEKGMEFGIWVEPEGVNPNSDLYKNHPDWVIQQPNRQPVYIRDQLTLDLSNPKVQDYVVKTVTDILNKYPKIVYVKWDVNSVFKNFGSVYLSKDKQQQLWVDYTKGLYSALERIKKSFPEVVFQACGGGGSRADYGMLRYMNEFWTSDDTDAYQRIFIQWGTSHIMPALGMAAHVSASPNHQTNREMSIKFRFDVAMSGRLGLEMQPESMSESEKIFAKSAVAEYKRIRPIIQFGDLYRLRSPYESELASIMYLNDSKDKAIMFAWSMKKMIGNEYPNVKLKGLQKDKMYSITEINLMPNANAEFKSDYQFDKSKFSGEYLMQVGVNLFNKRRGDYQSVVFEIQLIN